jgi:hypothetical protein
MSGNEKVTCQYFSKMAFMEYHSLSVDPWTCMKTEYIPFKFSLLEIVVILQIVWEGHMSLTSVAVFTNTAVFWWESLELVMLTRNRKIYSSHTYLCKRLVISDSFGCMCLE